MNPTALCRLARLTQIFPLVLGLLLGASGLFAEEVARDFYKDPGLYPNRSYLNQHFNEHIDPFTGALQHHYVDIHLPGNGGFDLDVTRSYNSASVDSANPASYESLAGLGWTLHFGRVLKVGNTGICSNANTSTILDNPVKGLRGGTRYACVVAASNSAGTGAASPSVQLTPLTARNSVGPALLLLD